VAGDAFLRMNPNIKKFNKKIFLIGLRATGKTSVGKLIAESLSIPFYDLDDCIVQKADKSIKDIVSEWGWSKFRELEQKELSYFLSIEKPVVVACGGGAVLHIDIWRSKKTEDDIVIWLDASIDEMAKRILEDSKTDQQRPTLINGLGLKEEIKKLKEQRLSLYEELADITINTDLLDLETVKKEILKRINI